MKIQASTLSLFSVNNKADTLNFWLAIDPRSKIQVKIQVKNRLTETV